MEMMPVQIIDQPHPLIATADRRISAVNWCAGETARGALLRAGLDPHMEISILVNDRMLTVEEWDSVCPQPGDLVHAVAALSGGGDGGSNPLKIVLSIAVMVAAFYLGPMLGASLGGFESVGAMTAAGSIGSMGLSGAAWSAIGSGLISLAGNLVVGALFAPSAGAISAVNGAGSAASPTYSLSGGSNSMRPYGPMQVVMGQHRVFPDYGAKPFTEFHGQEQYLYQIFNFGLSSCAFTDLRIGDSVIGNYSDVTLNWSDGNGNLPGFPGNVDAESGAKLVKGDDWLTRTSGVDTVRLAVDVEGSIYFAGENGLIPCTVRIEVQYAPTGSGAWAPMTYGTAVTYTTGYWSLQTTETVTNEFSETTTTVIQHEYAKSGHTEGETKQIGTTSTLWGGPVTPIYATWHWELFATGWAGSIPSPYPNDGPQPIYTTTSYIDIEHGASQTPIRQTFALSVAKGIYDVRVRLTSARSTLAEIGESDSKGGYSYAFSTLRSYQEDTAAYSGQTRLGMVIKASGQLSGVVQRFSALASAYTYVYVDGAWRWQPSSNPAWWYLDFARGRVDATARKKYGCHLPDTQIDVAALMAWAAFCDTEKLTINMVLDSQQSASDTLSDIARCGLASPSWSSGKLGVVWDKRNASPVAAFGMSNIMKGSFSVRYVTENLADEIVVTYVDKDRNWEQQQIRKTVAGVVNPQRPSTLEIKGCTNAALAGKIANIQAASQVYRRRQITWDTDVEGLVCQRGDVVLLQHDLTQWGYSGRVVNVVGKTITLDRAVPRSGSVTVDYMMLVRPDGIMQTMEVNPAIGDSDTIVLAEFPPLLPGALLIDHRWFFSPLPTPGKRVKIVSVKPQSQYRMQIVATDEDPEFYAAWDGTFTAPPAQTLLKNLVPEISSIAISEALVRTGPGTLSNRITVSLAVSGTFDSIYTRYRIASGPWTNKTIYTEVLEFDTEETGLLEVEATAAKGVSLGLKKTGSATILGKTAPPADVPFMTIDGNILTWGAVTDMDLDGYALRWQTGNSWSWEDAQPMHPGLLTGNTYDMTVRPSGAVSLLVKAVDTSKNYSLNPAAVVTDLGDPLVENVIVTQDCHAIGFPGTISGSTIEGGTGDLIANVDAVPAMWSNDASALWNVDPAHLQWSDYTYSAISYTDTFTVTAPDVGSQLTLPCTFTAGIFSINYRKDSSALMWETDSYLMWSGDPTLLWDYNDWMAWPGSIYAELATYEFQVLAGSAVLPIQPRISALKAVLDVPDIVERFNNISTASGGTRLSITKTYRVIKNVALTLQDDGGAARTVIAMDKSTALGPLVKCLNSAGAGTTGLIDATIQGY